MLNVSVTRSGTTLTLEHDGCTPIQLQELLCDLERAVIEDNLKRFKGVKARAADHLCLNRTTLVEKARKYGFPLKKACDRGE